MAEGKYKALPNKEYWIARSEELENKVHKSTLQMEKQLDKIYRQHIAEISVKIESFFQRYAVENKISLQEAEKKLDGITLAEYKGRMGRLLNQYRQTQSPYILGDIHKITTQGQLSRLEGLLNELMVELGLLSHNAQMGMEDFLGNVYEEAYYQSIYGVQKGTGMAVAFAKPNKEAVKVAINYAWSGDMFSSRIWKNKDKLLQSLKEELVRGMIQGTSTQSMAKSLKDKMNTSSFNAKRIIRTEANFVLNEATARGYESQGLEKYEILATLDSRTSSVCQKHDGKIYNVKDKVAGVNYPPFHPHCRTTVIPYFEKNNDSVRVAREADGQNTYVPANTTYKQWKEQNKI